MKNKLTNLDTIINVSQIALMHICILGFYYFGYFYLDIKIYIPVAIILNLIHQRATSEWIHESAHFNLIRNKKINDLFTDWFLGFLFFNDIRAHRSSHFEHHRQAHFLNPNDPDTFLLSIKSKRDFLRGFFDDLSGRSALRMLRSRETVKEPLKKSFSPLKYFAIIHIILFLLTLRMGRFDIYLLYFGTLGTLYPVINRIRVYGQHAEIHPDHAKVSRSSASRTIKTSLLGRVFINSDLMKYHFEHHASPQTPYRHLSKSQRANKSNINEYALSHYQVIKAIYKRLPDG